MAEQKKKINWLLILQGWTMLWVVIGHAFLGSPGEGPVWENYLTYFAYSFHMPLFMLVSGWLFYCTRLKADMTGGKNWSYAAIVKDKSMRLLLPGVVFSILAFVLKTIFPGEMVRQTDLGLQGVLHSFLYPVDNPFQEIWFIVTLFCFFLMTPLWRFVLNKRIFIIIAFVIFLTLQFFHPKTTFLAIDRVCTYALWFFLGLFMAKTDIVEIFIKWKPWIALVAGIIIYVVGIYGMSLFRNIGGITISFSLAILLDQHVPQIFSSFRDYTYQIFLMGIFAQIFIKILYRHLPILYIVAYCLCIIVGVLVPVLVSKLIEKINWKPLSLCVGLKTK